MRFEPIRRGYLSRKSTRLLIILLILLPGALAGERLSLSAIRHQWPATEAEEEQKTASRLQERFDAYGRDALGAVGVIARSHDLAAALADTAAQERLFQLLLASVKPDLSLELFDRQDRLVGWAGNRGPLIDAGRLSPQPGIFMLDGPIYSYLVAVVPVKQETAIEGFLVGKKLFDVNFPINNRFINSSAFQSTFTSDLDIDPDFDFSSRAGPGTDDRRFAIPLSFSGGPVLGYAYLQKPTLTGRIEDNREFWHDLDGILIAGIALAVLFQLVSWKPAAGRSAWKLVALTAWIWIFRYSLVVLDYPAAESGLAIFDPKYFASPFGFGLTKSIGDLFLTSVFLLANLLFVGLFLWRRKPRPAGVHREAAGGVMSVVLLILSGEFIRLMTLGLSVLVGHAVFDSNLAYSDPASVIPSPVLATMLLGLFLVVVTVILASAAAAMYAVARLSRHFSSAWLPRIAAFGVFLSVILVTDAGIGDSPGIAGSMVFLVAVFTVGYLFERRLASGLPAAGIGTLSVLLLGAAVILIPAINENVHVMDRNRVERMARDLAQPADNWLTLIVNQALDEVSGKEAAATLSSGDPDDVSRLAFTEWAKSILGREGNNCSVSIFDSAGTLVSGFHVGLAFHDERMHHVDQPSKRRPAHIEDAALEGVPTRFYVGSAPVLDTAGNLLGSARIEVSADREALIHGDAPEILRSSSSEDAVSRGPHLILTEYYQGRVVSTTGEQLPRDRALPEALQHPGSSSHGVWIDEDFDGKEYETYLIPDQQAVPASGDSWIALSMDKPDLRWQVYMFLRYMIVYLGVYLAMLGIALLVSTLRRREHGITFRTKLMAAFVIVSLIPVIILAAYNRQYAFERAAEMTTNVLSRRTSVVAAELQRQLGNNSPASISQLSNALCAEIANDLNTDFNVYLGGTLQASSKPEMFAAELLDPTLSANAYLNVVLRRKAFFTESQAIGKFPYVVGYRPLIAQNGAVTGLVAVPTIYQMGEAGEELARRNVFLFGAYALAMLLSLVAGTAFAGQISLPIRLLKSATEDVRAGKLDVSLPNPRRDEIGDLEQAFQDMTKDLKTSREELIRTQREHAWREMAKQVAHEIKNPLTPMKLSVQHLRRAYGDRVKDFESVFQTVCDTLLDQIDALSRIATEFSHFARMPERRLESCDLVGVLREAVSLYGQAGQPKITLDTDACPAVVHADREELRRVFINIIRNAIQALEGRGTITIATRCLDGFVEVRIQDDGPGITAEAQEHLFEPNFSTKTDGMGLGLAIVKTTIDQLGGTISVRSVPGRGTTVSIRLPLTEPGGGGRNGG